MLQVVINLLKKFIIKVYKDLKVVNEKSKEKNSLLKRFEYDVKTILENSERKKQRSKTLGELDEQYIKILANISFEFNHSEMYNI